MSTTLQNLIQQIKTTALANGFVSVEELKLNLKSNADTKLPKLFIRLNGLNYNNFLVDSSVEQYRIELIIILADSDNPVSDLKTLMDNLLNKLFNENQVFAMLARNKKIELVEADLTNDRDLYSKFGGEGVTLKMNITNVNNFGGASCL